MKSTPSPPAAPDPKATAAAQGTANLETAVGQGWLNALNQYGPQGSITYSQTGTHRVGDQDVPQFAQTTTLSPEQQRQYDMRNSLNEQALGLGGGVLNNVGNAVSSPFSLDGIPQAPGVNDFSADRDKVTNAIVARNQPMMDRTRAGIENQLANQGIMAGSEAYKNKMDDLARQENDFNLAAVNAGGAEQSRLFGLGEQARQQAISEAQLKRSQPINEYATLLGLGGNIQTPQANYQPPQLANTDTVGPTNLMYQNQLAGWNANNSARQSTMGSLFGLGGALGSAAIMASDIRLKENIVHVGFEKNLPVYHFSYRDDPQHLTYRGVMAQDVIDVDPDAIVIDRDGYMSVDYNRIGIEFGRVH